MFALFLPAPIAVETPIFAAPRGLRWCAPLCAHFTPLIVSWHADTQAHTSAMDARDGASVQ